jgi:hypothetical protein
LSVGRLLRSLYLRYWSQPAADRALFKAIHSQPIRSIVELGIGLEGRTQRVLEVCLWHKGSEPLRYTGIDLFEARPAGQSRLTLKEAFARLREPGVRVQLVPGDPHAALRQVANSLAGTDLLLIAADQDRESLMRAWPWMPRMLSPTSLVFQEEAGAKVIPGHWRKLSVEDVRKLAAEAGKSLRRAA